MYCWFVYCSLVYTNSVENSSKNKIEADEVYTNITDINQIKSTNLKVSPKKEVHQLKEICQLVQKNDELNYGICKK